MNNKNHKGGSVSDYDRNDDGEPGRVLPWYERLISWVFVGLAALLFLGVVGWAIWYALRG